MSTATRPTAPETPSKKVAAGFANIDVNATPSKKGSVADDSDDFSEPAFLTKGKIAPTPAAEVNLVAAKKGQPLEHSADTMHKKFVGDVDLPEEEEPLLVESSRRFVLFPIRYHEVSNNEQ